MSSYSCWDNGGSPADRSEQLKNHSELCVCLHQYITPLGRKRKERAQRRNREIDKGKKGQEQGGVDITGNKKQCTGRKDKGGKVINREEDGRIDPEKWEFNAKGGGGREIDGH